MLTITVGGTESFNEETSEFVIQGGTVLELEHSLVSLSKWEQIFEKPFLGPDPKTGEEVLGYIRCMNMDPETPPEVFDNLSQENLKEIDAYINKKMTATTFSDAGQGKKNGEIFTSELFYYWMTVYHIPFECQHWHLNRLLTLIRICNVKQEKPKKMSRAEQAQRNRELNAQRRAKLGTSG